MLKIAPKLTFALILQASLIGAVHHLYKVDDPAHTIIENMIIPFINDNKIPGLAIATYVDQKDSILCYGLSNKKHQTPITQDTLFEIGSVTKVFTATELALEVLQNRMYLDNSITEYVPTLRKTSPIVNVTLLQLATHTSSLPRVAPKQNVNHKYTRGDLIHFINTWTPQYPIGSHYLYSNLAFGLLGFALENIEEKSYQMVIRKDICTPLGMTSTWTDVPNYLMKNLATGYSAIGVPIKFPWKVIWKGSGALRSSPKDMLQFLKANLGVFGPSRLKDAMQLAQKSFFIANDKLSLGLAWQRSLDKGILIIDKDGAVPGFSTYIGMIPSNKIGIVICINRREKGITQLGRKILLSLLKNKVQVTPTNIKKPPIFLLNPKILLSNQSI